MSSNLTEKDKAEALRRQRWNGLGEYDHGWWNGLSGALARAWEWFVVGRFRGTPASTVKRNVGSTYNLLWPWHAGWEMGR